MTAVFSYIILYILLFQEVFWGENWSVFRLARLVHRNAVSCSSGRPPGIPVRHVHSGAVPGQVNTPLSSYKNSVPRAGIVLYTILYMQEQALSCFFLLFV